MSECLLSCSCTTENEWATRWGNVTTWKAIRCSDPRPCWDEWSPRSTAIGCHGTIERRARSDHPRRTLRKAASMARLDTMSNTLTPSMESTWLPSTLVDVGHAFRSCSSPQSALEWSSEAFHSRHDLLGDSPTDQTSHDITRNDAPDSPIRFLERCHPPHADCSGASPGQLFPCSEEPVQIAGSGQQGSDMFRSHARQDLVQHPARCPQILRKQCKWDLRNEFQHLRR